MASQSTASSLSFAADDLLFVNRSRIIFELMQGGIFTHQEAEAIFTSGVFGHLQPGEAFERIKILRSLLGDQRLSPLLRRDPYVLLLPLENLAERIRDLIVGGSFGEWYAKNLMYSCIEIVGLTRAELRAKLDLARFLIPDQSLRNAILLLHPDFLLLPLDHLKSKRPFGWEMRVEDIWQALVRDERGAIVLPSSILADLRRLPPSPRLPAPPPPSRTRTKKPGTTAKPKPQPKETPVAPPPLAEPRPVVQPSPADLDADRRYPLCAGPLTSDILCPLDDCLAQQMIRFLLSPGCGIKYNRDAVPAKVRCRPWMYDPRLEVQRVLFNLVELKLKGERLTEAINRHGAVLALGWQKLGHALSFLSAYPSLDLPRSLTDLPIRREVFFTRIEDLKVSEVSLSDPRYKRALFAPTERQYLIALESPDTRR